MKKVSLIIPSLRGGGAERVMLNLANNLTSKGYIVDLVLFKKEGEYINRINDDVNIVNLFSKRTVWAIYPLIKYLKKHKPEVVLSAMMYVNICVLVASQLSRVKAKVIISEHSTYTASLKHNRTWKSSIINLLARFLYKKSDNIVCVSKGVADDLKSKLRLNESAVKVIYNPVVTDSLLAEKDLAPQGDFFNSDENYILSVGRFVVAKDFVNLIKAYSVTHSKNDYKLVILGEGPLRDELQTLIFELGLKDKVVLPGFVENPYSWMRKANLFVMSSVYEGLSNVLIEALACGCKVVSTDCPSGPNEILEGGKWGRLVPVSNYELLAKAIDEALDDYDSLDPLKRAMFFTDKNSVSDYISLIES